ncbi:hypothetical protein Bpfe_012443 [Biomphalaria pfeifferi]|uniref:Uncharacterized protein n=1 Tax=Biomphalaria pfeifferi TaxID=112525 RepID=A0AAD8BQT4_BIOPF|nr:hypothetical protein Bpfe_012443 [Biomphalaria pfeifferi]
MLIPQSGSRRVQVTIRGLWAEVKVTASTQLRGHGISHRSCDGTIRQKVTTVFKFHWSHQRIVWLKGKRVWDRDKDVWGRDNDVWGRDKDVWGRDNDVWSTDKDVWGRDNDVWSTDKDVWGRDKNVCVETKMCEV